MMTLIINGLILALLAGAIGYIFIVDMRVRKLLRALHGLEPMVGAFSNAVDRSETSLENFKSIETAAAVNSSERSFDDEKKEIFKAKQNLIKSNVGWVPLPGKSDLVRSFFETARGQES